MVLTGKGFSNFVDRVSIKKIDKIIISYTYKYYRIDPSSFYF